MGPADEGLCADDSAESGIDDGLIVNGELLLFNRDAEIAFEQKGLAGLLVLLEREEVGVDGALAVMVGHGGDGLVDQPLGIDDVSGVD